MSDQPIQPAGGAARFTGIQLLTRNVDAWRAKRQLIGGATKSLDLCYFILEHDATSATLLGDLIAAAGRGVQVRLLLDHFMTFKQADVLRALAGVANLQVRRYRPPTPQWLAALRELGIDEALFVGGLMAMDMKVMASAFDGNTIFSPEFGKTLRELKPLPGESRFSVALRMRNAVVNGLEAELGTFKDKLLKIRSGNLFDVVAQLAGTVTKLPQQIELLGDAREGLDEFLHRTHHKLLLADGCRFIMGGRNMADEYHLDAVPAPDRPFIDTDVLVHDSEGAPEHRAAFEALWDDALAFDVRLPDAPFDTPVRPLADVGAMAATLDAAVQAAHVPAVLDLPDAGGFIVNNNPGPDGDHCITDTYVACIRREIASGRKGRIDLVSAYVCLVEAFQGSQALGQLRSVLLDAAAAGLTVNLYTNSIRSTDLRSINAVAYFGLARMIQQGVNVYELDDGQGSLHTKAAAIGDQWLLVGSYNLDPRSELYDTNNLIGMNDPSGQATAAFRTARIDALKWTELSAVAALKLFEDNKAEALKLAFATRLL